MELLPSELIECVLQKLAAQDPRSLLPATCACKSLRVLARPDWRGAFLAPEPGESPFSPHTEQKILGTDGRESAAKLDAEVARFGGYAKACTSEIRQI